MFGSSTKLNLTLLYLLQWQMFNQEVASECKLIDKDNRVYSYSHLSTFPNGSHPKVKYLICSNNDFHELKPFVFFDHDLYNVSKVILRYNNISRVHVGAFAKMCNMLELDLYGNKLTSLHSKTFFGLTSLKYLDIGHNQLSSMHQETLDEVPELEMLDLSYNSIKVLSGRFLERTRITDLDLSNNPLEFSTDGPIFFSLTLTKLFLQSCALKEVPSNAFGKLPKLTYLDLSSNELKVLGDDLLKPLGELQHLDISYNLLTHLSVELLPSKLEVILCNGNSFELNGSCEKIVELLQIVKTDHETDSVSKSVVVETTFLPHNLVEEVSKEMEANRSIEELSSNKESTETHIYVILGLSVFVALLLTAFLVQIQCIYYQKRNYSTVSAVSV